jgi:hypothetical protein
MQVHARVMWACFHVYIARHNAQCPLPALVNTTACYYHASGCNSAQVKGNVLMFMQEAETPALYKW